MQANCNYTENFIVSPFLFIMCYAKRKLHERRLQLYFETIISRPFDSVEVQKSFLKIAAAFSRRFHH